MVVFLIFYFFVCCIVFALAFFCYCFHQTVPDWLFDTFCVALSSFVPFWGLILLSLITYLEFKCLTVTTMEQWCIFICKSVSAVRQWDSKWERQILKEPGSGHLPLVTVDHSSGYLRFLSLPMMWYLLKRQKTTPSRNMVTVICIQIASIHCKPIRREKDELKVQEASERATTIEPDSCKCNRQALFISCTFLSVYTC